MKTMGCRFFVGFTQFVSTSSTAVLENVIELGNTETVKSCVAGDLGIALLPRFAVEPQLADGTLLAVDSDFSRERITAVCSYHKNKWVTPAMALFMELTREHFASL